VVKVTENAPDLVDAEDDRQGLGGTRTKQIQARPGALEGDFEKEFEGSDGDSSGGAGEATLLVEGKKKLAKVLVGDQVGRLAAEHRQLLDVAQVGLLGSGRQAAQLHILGHALA
jgi:hypothetical protein